MKPNASSIDSERTVLGAVLLHPSSLVDVLSVVDAQDFYHPLHRKVWEAIVDCDAKQTPVDQVSLSAALGWLPEAHDDMLARLAADCVTVENIAWHAERVRAKAERRRLVEKLSALTAMGHGDSDDGDFFQAVDTSLIALGDRKSVSTGVGMKAALRAWTRRLEESWNRVRAGTVIVGIPTGFADFDAITGGLRPGNQYVVAARPAMGKTAWALQVAKVAAMAGHPVRIISQEMPVHDLVDRFVSEVGDVDNSVLRSGDLQQRDWLRVSRATADLAELPITLDDESVTFAAAAARARRWRAKLPAGCKDPLVICDYMQLFLEQADIESRERQVAATSAGGKQLSKQIGVAVLQLAQLNRDCEKRQDKRPMMSDLRESGTIEQDADLIGFLYRDQVYHPKPDNPLHGTAELIIGKNRFGPMLTCWMDYEGSRTRFTSRSAPVQRQEYSEPARHWNDGR